MNAKSAQNLISLRETFEARFQTIVTAPMESRVAHHHGDIAKTTSPCSYVCVSRVVSQPMVPFSVIRCKVRSCNSRQSSFVFFLMHNFLQCLCDELHTVESESCASAIIMIVLMLRKFVRQKGSSLLVPQVSCCSWRSKSVPRWAMTWRGVEGL